MYLFQDELSLSLEVAYVHIIHFDGELYPQEVPKK